MFATALHAGTVAPLVHTILLASPMQVVLAKNKKTGEVAALKVVHLEAPKVDPAHLQVLLRCVGLSAA
jgi:hypothetical protein